MVDSRQKGARAEAALKKVLRDATGLNFQRTPGSGALAPTHMLKGDIYLPNTANRFCIEVKHYKDDHLTSKILTSKTPQLLEWWKQAVRQGKQVEMQPLLFFKFNMSKWFMATLMEMDTETEIIIKYEEHNFSVYNVDDIALGEINWILTQQKA